MAHAPAPEQPATSASTAFPEPATAQPAAEAPVSPVPAAPAAASDLSPRAARLLEVLPGLVTWVLILAPIALSVRFPELVAWFVLTFDFYWLAKALVLSASVTVTFLRIRRTLATDWNMRLAGLSDPLGRERVVLRAIAGARDRAAALARDGQRTAAAGARRVADALAHELNDLRRLRMSGIDVIDPASLVHVALIPTYTEPFEKLHATVRALAEAEWPTERKYVAIITRETDTGGRANVARLREEFGDRFGRFFHILDPLEPGIVVGKSSAMAYGGKWLYRELVDSGHDPDRVVVTDLDSDYRVHPAYFAYLAYRFATDPNRYRRLYQPVPMFHNNLWDVPVAVRLVAVGATHVQMWRSLQPERLVSFSSYAVALRTVHDVGYWATDAIPEDSRFYWKSFFTYAGAFRAEPLFIPIYGDAVRAKSYPRTLVEQYTQIRRWAWGVTDIPYYVRQALRHPEIPLGLRVRRLVDLWSDHLNWAIAPFVLLFGSNLPLLIDYWLYGGDRFSQTTLGQNLPLYAATMLTAAFLLLLILVWIEDAIAPPRPASWGLGRRILSYVQWLFVPIVGVVFSNLPALDAQTRLMAGRYLEYRVTPKA